MSPLDIAVLRTILYFNVCEFAPTVIELYRYLLHTESSAQLSEIIASVKHSSRLIYTEGYIVLPNQKHLISRRKEGYMYTEHKWQKNRWIFWLLACLPGVKGVWLCNTLGWGHAQKESDIDLCIIAQKNRIWTARLFTTMLLKILRRRPGECPRERAVCLSFYIDNSCKDLQKYTIEPYDIHFAFWITQMTPLYNAELFIRWTQKQIWVRSLFTHNPFIHPTRRRSIHIPAWIEFIKKSIALMCHESMLKKLQLFFMPKEVLNGIHAGVVVLNNDILKFHTHDTRSHINHQFQTACHAFNV